MPLYTTTNTGDKLGVKESGHTGQVSAHGRIVAHFGDGRKPIGRGLSGHIYGRRVQQVTTRNVRYRPYAGASGRRVGRSTGDILQRKGKVRVSVIYQACFNQLIGRQVHVALCVESLYLGNVPGIGHHQDALRLPRLLIYARPIVPELNLCGNIPLNRLTRSVVNRDTWVFGSEKKVVRPAIHRCEGQRLLLWPQQSECLQIPGHDHRWRTGPFECARLYQGFRLQHVFDRNGGFHWLLDHVDHPRYRPSWPGSALGRGPKTGRWFYASPHGIGLGCFRCANN